MTTPAEKDAMALAVLDELCKRFDATIPTPMNNCGESTMRIEHFVVLAHEAKQARAHLAERLLHLTQLAEHHRLNAEAASESVKFYTRKLDDAEAGLAEARDGWHMANGVAELAMQHRDAAEAELAAVMTSVRGMLNAEPAHWCAPNRRFAEHFGDLQRRVAAIDAARGRWTR